MYVCVYVCMYMYVYVYVCRPSSASNPQALTNLIQSSQLCSYVRFIRGGLQLLSMSVYVCIHICMYVCMYVCVYVCMCMYAVGKRNPQPMALRGRRGQTGPTHSTISLMNGISESSGTYIRSG